MRKLQKVKVTYKDGKKTDSVNLGDPKKVVDSTAEQLLLESDIEIKKAKANPKEVSLKIWQDKGEIKRPAKKKGNTQNKEVKD